MPVYAERIPVITVLVRPEPAQGLDLRKAHVVAYGHFNDFTDDCGIGFHDWCLGLKLVTHTHQKVIGA